MPYTAVTWAYQEVVSSAKLNTMAANDADQQLNIGVLKTYVQVAPAAYTIPLATTVETIVTGCSIALPAGTWDVSAKGYIDWSVSAVTRYVVRLRQGLTIADTQLDSAGVFTNAAAGTVPFTLDGGIITLAVAGNVSMTVIQSTTGLASGGQSVQTPKIKARRIA